MGKTLKERMEENEAQAKEELERMKDPAISREEFGACVRRFTLCKFTLEEEECEGIDDILALADISVEKLLRINDKSVRLMEGSNTCTNQSSTDVKKILLSMTLQRALGVHFTPEEGADLETVAQLAGALYDGMRENQAK